MVRVTKDAKDAARSALIRRVALPRSQKFGLNKSTAQRMGINSGVERAKQILRKSYFRWENPMDRRDLISMYRFYKRFKNFRGPRAEGALDLWGGRRWLSTMVVPYVAKRL